jgi:hypothetical protein
MACWQRRLESESRLSHEEGGVSGQSLRAIVLPFWILEQQFGTSERTLKPRVCLLLDVEGRRAYMLIVRTRRAMGLWNRFGTIGANRVTWGGGRSALLLTMQKINTADCGSMDGWTEGNQNTRYHASVPRTASYTHQDTWEGINKGDLRQTDLKKKNNKETKTRISGLGGLVFELWSSSDARDRGRKREREREDVWKPFKTNELLSELTNKLSHC